MCPVCKMPMVAFELKGVEIDRCVGCGGTWLDAGELEQIAAVSGASTESLAQDVVSAGRGRRTHRRCPRCPARLREIRIGKEPEVQVDHCPEDHGLWFDRGEMIAAIRAHAGRQGAVVAAFFAELYRSEIEHETGGD